MKYFVGFLVFFALATGCEGDDSLKISTGSAYFPLRKGVFQIYAVNEVQYTASADPLALTYELMAQVVDSFPSATGTYTYVIHRSKRESPAEEWQPLDTWSARSEPNEIIVSEGDTPYVKIKLPARRGNVWNGNVFNAMGEDQYTLTDVDHPLDLNGMSFENTLTVEQENNGDVIVYLDERNETYALGVGLIYREITQLHYCTADACLGQQKIDHGIEIKMVITDYGKK